MNAWEDGNRIIADVMQFEEAPLFPHPDGRRTDPEKSRARHCRWTFDLAGNTDRFPQTYLDDLTGEFPRIDDRRAGLTNRHGWYACANPEAADVRRASPASVHVDGTRQNGSAIICCRPATRSPSRSSSSGRRMRQKATAGCSRWSGARGEPQRPRRVQRAPMSRAGPCRAGAARPPRAGRFSRQLGGGVTQLPYIIPKGAAKSAACLPCASLKLLAPSPKATA